MTTSFAFDGAATREALQVRPLGEIFQPMRPRVKPSDLPDLPFIGMAHVEPHTMKLLETVPAGTMKSSAVHFQPGDVLYGRLRPYLNKVYRPEFEGLCSAEFIVFPKTDGVESRYLQYFLNSAEFVSFATHLNTGDRPRVDFQQLAEYPFPLATPDRQKQIVAEIEKQFSRLDKAVTNLHRVKASLKRYKAAVFKAAVEGRLVETEASIARREDRTYETGEQLLERILETRRSQWKGKGKYKEPVTPDIAAQTKLPEGWVWASIDQLAGPEPNSITDGPFGSNLKTAHYTQSGPRVIRLQNIKDGEFADEYAHISNEHFEKLRKHEILAGDLVIATLGDSPPRACIIPSSVGPAIVKADCIRFSPHSELGARYLNFALNSPPVRESLKGEVHGVGRPRLKLSEIRAISLPIPPKVEQLRIISELESRLSVIVYLFKQLGDALACAELLRRTTLDKLYRFEG